MKITVILCTYKRCQSLAKALASVALSVMPDSVEWDVLVVDNNSPDKTRAVVEDFSARYPGRFRYVFEGQQGKSHALNSGIREANADVLAFMDDDVQVDPKWLQNLTTVLSDERWSGSGGRILPEGGFEPPKWLETKARYALAPLALFDLGVESCELCEAPFGTNMAYRREMFSKHGSFRTDLGPQPGFEMKNEDVEFGSRLLAGGEHLWYEKSAVVYHSMPLSRIQPAYFLSWWHIKSRAEIREHGIRKGTKWFLAGVPIYLLRALCAWTLRWIFSIDPGRRFSRKVKVWSLAGMIDECRKGTLASSQVSNGESG